MLEQIVLTQGNSHGLARMMNDNREYVGAFLAEITEKGIVPVRGVFENGGEIDASHIDSQVKPQFLQDLNRYAEQARSHPERYALIDVHTHGRTFGETIREYDPYWTIACTGTHPQGSVVNGKYYVSRRGGGDDIALERIAERLMNHRIAYYHLFVHPAYGSEGKPMSRDKVIFTAYKYDPSAVGRVKEIPVREESAESRFSAIIARIPYFMAACSLITQSRSGGVALGRGRSASSFR